MICQVTEVDSFLCNYNGNLMDGEKECSDAILREKMMRIVSVEMENQFWGKFIKFRFRFEGIFAFCL